MREILRKILGILVLSVTATALAAMWVIVFTKRGELFATSAFIEKFALGLILVMVPAMIACFIGLMFWVINPEE